MRSALLVAAALSCACRAAVPLPADAVQPSPAAAPTSAPTTGPLSLSTSPHHVYKEKDASGRTETFVFRLVVRGPEGRAAEPEDATVELRAGTKVLETLRYSAEALAAVRGHASTRFSPDFDALYELRFAFKEPAALGIDAALVRLDAGGSSASLLVPITVYAQKTKLRFPINGDFMVVTGHVGTEGGHEERSQLFAFDILGLGPHLELLSGDGTKNTDFVGYGREVMAPADGVVSYARNDVPDNPASGNQDMESLLRLPESPWGVAGNCIVIDHGNGEWSFLAHLQPGSVRVKKGDRVKQGEVVGRLGNSGGTTGPHVHFHLMDGPEILHDDGLPARFENTCVPVPRTGRYCDAK